MISQEQINKHKKELREMIDDVRNYAWWERIFKKEKFLAAAQRLLKKDRQCSQISEYCLPKYDHDKELLELLREADNLLLSLPKKYQKHLS